MLYEVITGCASDEDPADSSGGTGGGTAGTGGSTAGTGGGTAGTAGTAGGTTGGSGGGTAGGTGGGNANCPVRITSYNVCYTKLLRQLMLPDWVIIGRRISRPQSIATSFDTSRP